MDGEYLVQPVGSIYFFIMFATLSVAILIFRYSITIRRFLKSFIQMSQKVSKGELHTRLHISARGELGQLARNFNYMMETLESTIEEVEYKHLQLTSVLKSISHGILVIDIDGNIILINDEARSMIKSKFPGQEEGKNIRQIINEEQILYGIIKHIGSKGNHRDNLNLDDEIVYKLKIDPVYLQNSKNAIIGSIINIEDITELIKLENMRKDFVANVSHELKTPLTSISGFVETLKLNENIEVNTRNRFLGIIESESNRLKRLIDDILLLSFIEKQENTIQDSVSIYEVFIEVYDMTSYMAKSKNIKLSYEFKDKKLKILGNRDHIKQVFLNLVDNAIKYTPENKDVNVSVFSEKNKIVIKVSDQGVGIPEEDINRIFERFYRVDKARSRDVGGTGLGLAITKHIVKSLGGTISVKSEFGKGSEFTVVVPQKNFL